MKVRKPGADTRKLDANPSDREVKQPSDASIHVQSLIQGFVVPVKRDSYRPGVG
jgi:hypothetical protein